MIQVYLYICSPQKVKPQRPYKIALPDMYFLPERNKHWVAITHVRAPSLQKALLQRG